MRVETRVLQRSAALRARGVSDHSPIVCTFADVSLRRRRGAPVPRCVFHSGEHEVAAQRLLSVVEGG